MAARILALFQWSVDRRIEEVVRGDQTDEADVELELDAQLASLRDHRAKLLAEGARVVLE